MRVAYLNAEVLLTVKTLQNELIFDTAAAF